MPERLNRYPFSWTLLLIAVLHFSVFSLGVTEPHSKDYFFREQANFASAYIPQQLFCESYSFGEFIQAQQLKQLQHQHLQFQESELLLAQSFLQKPQGLFRLGALRGSDARYIALLIVALVYAASSSGSNSEESHPPAFTASTVTVADN